MMLFVPMGRRFLCCMIILSTCFLLQSTVATQDEGCSEQAADVGIVKAKPTSESSIVVTWAFYETPTSIILKTPDGGISVSNHSGPGNFADNLQDLEMEYRPCCPYDQLLWPTLVQDPVTNIYVARYKIDESTFASRSKKWSKREFSSLNYFKGDTNNSLRLASGLVANVTDLPLPDCSYVFSLKRIFLGSSNTSSAQVLGRTNPAPLKLCAGCFRILWTHPREQWRKVRVYWRTVGESQFAMYRVVGFEKFSDRERQVLQVTGLLQEGYTELVLSFQSHILEFSLIFPNKDQVAHNSTIVIPEEGNVFNWVPQLTTTTATSTSLLWEKPNNLDIVDYYTLVWYDKRSSCPHLNCSPIMDWVYIPGNQTSIKFKIMNSSKNDNVGWWISANTKNSSSSLQNID